jgi:hypothetical protein
LGELARKQQQKTSENKNEAVSPSVKDPQTTNQDIQSSTSFTSSTQISNIANNNNNNIEEVATLTPTKNKGTSDSNDGSDTITPRASSTTSITLEYVIFKKLSKRKKRRFREKLLLTDYIQ